MAEPTEHMNAETQCLRGGEVDLRISWTTLVPFIFGAYFVFGLMFAWLYRYQINPDGVSMLTVAEQYADGNWDHAINGFWGPLVSWLLVPLIALGIDPQSGFRLLNWLIGACILVAAWKVSGQLLISERVRVMFLVTVACLTMAWSVRFVTADLLVVCVVLFLVDLLNRPDLLTRPKYALLCGALGALAYFSKPFGFIFFILAFLLTISYRTLIDRSHIRVRTSLSFVGAGLAMFLLLTGPWIAAISAKHDGFTISPSGSRNLGFVAPGEHDQPHYTEGLIAPPFEGAISVWYDPSLESLPAWRPWQSTSDFIHETKNIARNLITTANLFGLGAVLALGLFLTYVVRGGALQVVRSPLGYCLLVVAAYFGLYALVRVELRYLWPAFVLLWLIGYSMTSRLAKEGITSARAESVINVALALAFILNPIIAGMTGTQTILVWTFGTASISLLIASRGAIKGVASSMLLTFIALLVILPAWNGSSDLVWRGIRPLITDLPQQAAARDLAHVSALPKEPGNVASNVWNKGLYLSYYHKANYYGIPQPSANDAENRQSLADHQIEWFLLWGKETPVPAYLSDYTQTAVALDGDLRILRRN